MDLKKINSMTKYPSILTYHKLGERGKLTPEIVDENGKLTDAATIYVYEKVDGENSRIIFLKNPFKEWDYLIGSREELLYAKGDRIGNPYGNIAEFLKPIAEQYIENNLPNDDWALTVVYQESYGGKTKAAKNYTGSKQQSYRVFDVFSLTEHELTELLALPNEKIAEWREHGNQPFYNEEEKARVIEANEWDAAPLLTEIKGSEFPVTLEDTHNLLKNFERTEVGIDAAGKSEGIVVRSVDRKQIRKIRFEDYERTFRQ